MKIGIVTLVSDNYGNKFQNYAVEQILHQYGDIETFQLAEYPIKKSEMSLLSKLKFSYIRQVLVSRMMYKYDITNAQRSIIQNLLYVTRNKKNLLESQEARHKKFIEFQSKYLHVSNKILDKDNCSDLEWQNQYACFTVGSDQIWNPSYSTTTELAFLNFVKNRPTIAIAPSFGISEIPEKDQLNFQNWLNKITYLSVRENAGKNIIRNLTEREAEVLVDPTMVLQKEKWELLMQRPSNLPKRYVLCYFLGMVDREYKQYIEIQAKNKGLEIVELFNIEKPEYYILDPSEVLYCIRHAEIVYTDSFHGTIFSILFQKQFLVFERNESGAKMNSRLDTLLSTFGLSGNTYDEGAKRKKQVDWCKVDAILTTERERFTTYLERCMKKVGSEKSE